MNTLTKENNRELSEKVEEKDQKQSVRVYSPNVDVMETEEAILFRVEMPGVDQTSVEISIEKDQLILEGKFVTPTEPRGQVRLAEYREGNYFRKFTIGKAIHSDKAIAKMKNGILELTIPKMEPKKTKIEIQM
ncbi:Hsp20/alpha crystallin family protein [Leptospira sp. 2 VSF19]|uniref:Hsp20/alpha crystallin family protein n=1 Tax=Leptospira soteropolitanensis TaxID=2950025 RepID=A0AAW5VED4_9LEPT|nr:Hsp20/alpha crystallin family protein [Leptospira soteropolitanensis]MCW7492041.1 Hsp20/alpha crystallin family protein [Leptospira soteropolitanensis]MCW7499623.1 Hsp20/alpha crystallin family protein [Leptospira soteropolitanensis]MCW7521874.1 Hsp20/alpha crystallin family protein [Leptospira soteropolitanensis]MCW7525728.1 Hsp20/alpha crystallin family protein [Leptospira soteropolitanensis]MCW7530158.1 Hsp20/alpha crystallin family protein [Leptospira soteropolitanensis]